MKLEQQVVSLDLAKRLKELGVKQEALYWWSDNTVPATLWNFDALGEEFPNKTDNIGEYAAFTVAELGEMLKDVYFSKWETVWDSVGDNWRGSLNTGTTNSGQLIHHWVDADTEADARAKCLIYLLENGLIKG